jgi:hypothetical protein
VHPPAARRRLFDAVAQAVIETSRLSCELDIPVPGQGTLDQDAVNVQLTGEGPTELLFRVDGPDRCGPDGGWYYDNPTTPSAVILCEASCDNAQSRVGPGRSGRIEVVFGCESVVR